MSARCQCGQLSAQCHGEPVRVSVCHCHDCQLRSGSAFAAQVRFRSEHVQVSGEYRSWTRIGESGGKAFHHFCPICGSTLFYELERAPELRAIAMGAFAGIDLPTPGYSVYEERKASWIAVVGDGIEHHD